MNFSRQYTFICDKFYCFPLVKAVIGIEFANLNDAMYFKRLIEKFSFTGAPDKVVKEERKKFGVPSYRISTPNYFVRK